MFLLVLASLAMFGTIAYTIALQDISNYAITYITGLLISVTGILLGLASHANNNNSPLAGRDRHDRPDQRVHLHYFDTLTSISVPNRGRTIHHTHRLLLDFDHRGNKTTAPRCTGSQSKLASRKHDWLI